jgi:superfamily II DNA or RNA helicase
MKTTINNNTTIISGLDATTIADLCGRLSFKDRAKEYQVRRMSKTIWGRTSPQVAKLKSEIDQCLVTHISNTDISIPTGLVGSLADVLNGTEVCDLRSETGSKIALPWKNKPHNLREYQQEAVDLMLQNRRGLINLATGLGKTLTATHAIRSIGRKTLIVCPSKAIAEQFYSIVASSFGKERIGFFGDGKSSIKDITVGIAPSVCNHLDQFKSAGLGLIIFDETHHIAANTFYAIADALSSTGRIYGLTATDFRNDGKDLLIEAGCGPTLICRDAKWGIDHDFLAKPYFIVRNVETVGRDYKDDKLKSYKAHILHCDVMKKQIEDDARKFMDAGKRVLILVDEVEHGELLSKALSIPFATGEDKQSQTYIDDFNAKKVMGLVGTDGKIGEGVDTRPVDVLIMAHFVASKGAVLQAVGRGLRKIDGKDNVIVLDYIPRGSTMLTRHAKSRIEIYKELTDKVKVI